MRRVAVVGSGIAGLAAAHALKDHAQLTLFEAGDHFGGHARTVNVRLEGIEHPVDTGFLVFNHRTYPGLTKLFDTLGVGIAPSDMSLSVQRPHDDLEWCGNNLDTLFAQRSNLFKPGFWAMLADLLRFNRIASAMATQPDPADLELSLEDFLQRHGLGRHFRDDYLLPMVASIWSCPADQMLRFPVVSLVRFCHNHGLLSLTNRPQWKTVVGGSRDYVQRIVRSLPDARLATPVRTLRRVPPGSGTAGIWVRTDQGEERFDQVVLACHSPQALQLLPDATPDERAVLGAIGYQRNRALLHTDASLLPRRRKAWAAWNFEAGPGARAVCLHYWLNRLQPLPWQQPVIESLNPLRQPAPHTVIGECEFEHPVFDRAALAAQQLLPTIQGRRGVWFCGAWAGHGFHEDGLRSAEAIVEPLLGRLRNPAQQQPWAA